jgi:RHS repeat-associated protein
VNYTYDAADQLTEVVDWSSRRTRFAYDSAGRISRIDFPNGAYRVISYDRAGRPAARTDHASGGAVICGYRYEYAIDGRLDTATRTDTLLHFVPVPATMTFDDANRVTSYNGSSLTSELGGGLTRVPLVTGFANVAYDTRHRVSAIGATTFNYDPEDRLTGWRDNAGTTSLFVDPHAGLSRVLERTTPDGNTTRYVHGLGLLYEETGTTIRVYHYDDRGSTVALSDNAGQVTQRFAYGPYGEEIDPGTGTNTTPFRFLGLFGVLTEPNGNLSMRNRVYSPVLRRFISEDFYPGELATPNSLNRYAYANGDPLSFEDPDGEFINVLIGAVAGAIGGVAVQAVSDLIRGKKPNWRDYVSAAAGGAITGALIGSGFGAVAAGAAGGLTQNFLDQSLNGALTGERDFDFLALGVATGVGAAGGKIGGNFTRGINGAAGSAFRKQVVYNGILFSTKRAALRAPVIDLVKRSAIAAISQAASGAALGVAKGTFLRLTAGDGDSPGSAGSGIPPTISSRGRYDQIHRFVGQGQRSRQGPFLHFSLYESWLNAALVPFPNSPNAQPAGF